MVSKVVQPRRKALENRLMRLAERGNPDLLMEEMRRFGATLCGARTRRGTSCQRKALQNGRCPNHGGLSTGPRTPEGQLRAIRADGLAALKR